MPKKVSEYYDQLIQEKNSFSSLNSLTPSIDSSQNLLQDLQSTSRVSRWRMIVWLMAYAIWLTVFACEQLAAQTESGTGDWYQRKAFEFQFGDDLLIVNNKPSYAALNPLNQIIKYASVITANNVLFIKVAKDVGNNPSPLTTNEKMAFEYYIDRVKFAGTSINVVSQAADDLMANYKVIYNPLILDNTGVHLVNGSKPVEDAINTYLRSLAFDGVIHADKLTDAIQSAEGVAHVVMQDVRIKPWYESAANYLSILSFPNHSLITEAGFSRISAAAGESLVDTITYESL